MQSKTESRRMTAAVERALFKLATGYYVSQPETIKRKCITYTDAGKKVSEEEVLDTVTTQKFIPPNLDAIELWLKASTPEVWNCGAQPAAVSHVQIVDDIATLVAASPAEENHADT